MYICLKKLVYLSDRDERRKTMPMCISMHFRTKALVIIDCLKVYIDRPSNDGLCTDMVFLYSSQHNKILDCWILLSSNGCGGKVTESVSQNKIGC